MDALRILVFAITLLIMLIGLAGTVLPALPGLTLMWIGALGYGLFVGFETWGIVIFAVMTVLTIIGEASGYFFAQAGAAQTGASGWAIAASVVLGIVGLFVIPVVGGLIGAVLGVFLVEYYRRRNFKEAWKATTGTLWGMGLSFGLQVVIGVMLLALWGAWVFLG